MPQPVAGGSPCASEMIGEDPIVASLADRLDLARRILAECRQPCVANGHAFILRSPARSGQTGFRVAFVTLSGDYVSNVTFSRLA